MLQAHSAVLQLKGRKIMKVFKKAVLILLAAVMLCSAAGCVRGDNEFLNGHSWGETEVQTERIGWNNASFAGFSIGSIKNAYPVFTRHSAKGLYEVDYAIAVLNKGEEEVFLRLMGALGQPDRNEKSFLGHTELTWYRDTIRINVSLEERQGDYRYANGERTVVMSVKMYNDRYK